MKYQSCQICGHNKLFIARKGLYDDRYGAKGKHSLHVCKNCGFGKTMPGISKEKIGHFYSKYYPTSRYTVSQIIRSVYIPSPFSAWLKGLDSNPYLYARRSEKVLDVGFGTGTSLLAIRQLGAKPYGVEPDKSVQSLSKKLKLPIHIGFITDNPFPKLRFGLITASQVLEHEPDPLSFLLAIRGKLSKNGRVILSLPNYGALYRHIFGAKWLHWHIPYHLNFFNHRSLKILANKAGFTISSIRTITPSAWTLWQLHMLLSESKEGVVSQVWNQILSGSNPSHGPLKRRVLYLSNRILELLITPLNRIIDVFHLGESFLVELRPIK